MSNRDYKNIYHYKLVNSMLYSSIHYFEYKFLQKMWIIKTSNMYRKKYEEFLNKKSIIFCDTSLSFYNNQLIVDNAMTISVILSELSHENYSNRVISFNTDAKKIKSDPQ